MSSSGDSKAFRKPSGMENFLFNFGVGGVAAAASKTVVAPIERVKLLLQNQGDSKTITKPYKGIMDVFVRVPKEQGIAALWRGNVANVLRYFPTQALNFAFKDWYKSQFKNLIKPHEGGFFRKLAYNVSAGGAAGATSLLFVYPLDFARTRLGTDVGTGANREFNGLLDCFQKVVKADGIQGVYRGFVISCVGIIVYRGAYFGFYDQAQDIMKTDSFVLKFATSYTVTVAAGLLSYPIDTIRRRMMMTAGSGGEAKYSGSIDCAKKLLTNEGGAIFFKGAGANVLRGLGGALVLAGFDVVKSGLRNYFQIDF